MIAMKKKKMVMMMMMMSFRMKRLAAVDQKLIFPVHV
jgi:hypothetical protein